MGKNGVKVIIRTRPTANFATNQIVIDPDENTVTVHASSSSLESPTKFAADTASSALTNTVPVASVAAAAPSNKKDCWTFKYHQVLHHAGQDKVYDAIARDIVRGAVVDGVSGTILAYGQTGAGKSFTMIGDTRTYALRGIAPRAVAQVFSEAASRREQLVYHIDVSYMEIYNDRIYDLLAPVGSSTNNDLAVVDDARGTSVRGLTHVAVASEQQALDALFRGELQRTVAEHQLNKRSNRSHCIFTCHIAQTSRAGGNERVVHSKLHLVDLAGSERLKKTTLDTDGSTTKTTTIQKESMYINQSLSFLEQCIVALSAKDARQHHIPYRQTKLTHVLKSALGGNSNTLMFACIWGERTHLEETISTLKLAQRMMRVQNEVATTVVESDPTILVRKYERQIRDLKHELVMHDALSERTGVVYDEHTPEQKLALRFAVRQFVDASTPAQEDDALRLTSVREIRELFRQFKLLFQAAERDAAAAGSFVSTTSNRSGSAGSNGSRLQSSNGSRIDIHDSASYHARDSSNSSAHDVADNVVVGDDDPSAIGFGLGIASSAARPSTIDTVKQQSMRRFDAQASSHSHNGPSSTRHTNTNNNSSDTRDGRRRSQSRPSRHRSPSPVRSGRDASSDDLRDGTADVRDNAIGSDSNDSDDPDAIEALQRKSNAFRVYKTTGPGKSLAHSLRNEKHALTDARSNVQLVASRLNAAKSQIDALAAQLDEKRSRRSRTASGGIGMMGSGTGSNGSALSLPTVKRVSVAAAVGVTTSTTVEAPLGRSQPTTTLQQSQQSQLQQRDEVVDDEEFALMTAERAAKRDYRARLDDLKDAKSALALATRSVALVRMRVVREFDDWYGSQDDSSAGGSQSFATYDGSHNHSRHAVANACSPDDDDKLDDSEQFDAMEHARVRAQDPDSLAFFQAQKKMRQHASASAVQNSNKQLRKPKRK